MTSPDFVDPTADPVGDDAADPAAAPVSRTAEPAPSDDRDPQALLTEVEEGLYDLAVTAEALARRLSRDDVRLDRTQRSALETCRDNARAIVSSLDRVV